MTVIVRPLATNPPGGGVTPIQAQGLFFVALQNVAITPQTIMPIGGTGGPYTFADGGTLPAGITINVNTGQITGTPTNSGDVTATITITDGDGNTGQAIAAFAIGQTRFTDSFNRASTSAPNIGFQWAGGTLLPGVVPATFAQGFVGALSIGGACVPGIPGNVLQFSSVLQTGAVGSGYISYTPLPLLWSAVNDQSQYAQMRICRRAAGSATRFIEAGPAVMVTPRQFYFAGVVDSSGLFRISRLDGGGGTILATSGSVPVNGDIITIQIIRNGVVNNTINVYLNGVFDMTAVDASPLQNGYPGIAARAGNAVGTASFSEWRDYDGGLGTII